LKKDKFTRSTRERSKELVNSNIKDRFKRRLRQGIQTNYSGLFLMIPFLQDLQLEQKVKLLRLKDRGIPVLESFLYLVCLEMLGMSLSFPYKDLAPAIVSGLPAHPSKSYLHRFLERPGLKETDDFIKSLGRRQVENGQIKGKVLACDTTLAVYSGQMDILKDKPSQEKLPHKAVRFYVVVDQGLRNPLYLKAAYPGKGPVDVGSVMVDASLEILGDQQATFIFDKWFSVGELLEYIDQRGQKFITLQRRHANRIKEMESIPLEQFRSYTEYERITHIPVCLRNYSSTARLVVVELIVEGERFLFGYLTNDEDMADEEIAELYPTRWDSEFWIEEMDFMKLKHLPSPRLNKISFGLAAKLAAYNTMSAFRGNLGEEYIQHNVETICNMFFREQALVKLNNKEELEVTIFGHQHAVILKEMYYNLSAKLLDKGIDPGVSWLGGYPLRFAFK